MTETYQKTRLNDQKWPEMFQNDLKRLKTILNAHEWHKWLIWQWKKDKVTKMIKNDQEWLKATNNDQKQPKMTKNNKKMTQNNSRRPKLTKNDAKKQSVTKKLHSQKIT